MTTEFVNADNAMLMQLEHHWAKIAALLVWKLAPDGVHITTDDMLRFEADGRLLLSQGHRDSFELRMVTAAAAECLAAHDAATNTGKA